MRTKVTPTRCDALYRSRVAKYAAAVVRAMGLDERCEPGGIERRHAILANELA